MEQPPARSALELLIWHVNEGHGALKFRHSWIEGKNPQGPVDGIARASLVWAHVYVAQQERRHIEAHAARVDAGRGACPGYLRLPILRLCYARSGVRSRRSGIAGVGHTQNIGPFFAFVPPKSCGVCGYCCDGRRFLIPLNQSCGVAGFFLSSSIAARVIAPFGRPPKSAS